MATTSASVPSPESWGKAVLPLTGQGRAAGMPARSWAASAGVRVAGSPPGGFPAAGASSGMSTGRCHQEAQEIWPYSDVSTYRCLAPRSLVHGESTPITPFSFMSWTRVTRSGLFPRGAVRQAPLSRSALTPSPNLPNFRLSSTQGPLSVLFIPLSDGCNHVCGASRDGGSRPCQGADPTIPSPRWPRAVRSLCALNPASEEGLKYSRAALERHGHPARSTSLSVPHAPPIPRCSY